jgi:3-oxoadipate enol-lactonase
MRIQVEGADIYATRSGRPDRPALLLCNGARCNTSMWDPLMSELERRFLVVRHDVRGTGRSRLVPGAELGLDRYADDAAAVLDFIGAARCIVWGMAFGSRVALAFASRHSARVAALTLFDASVESPDPQAQAESARRARERRRALGMAEGTLDPAWFANDDPDTLRAALRAAYANGSHASYARRLRVPTLIATGEFDPNLSASRRLHRMIPESELVVLEAVGHGSVLQRPALCLEVFEHFLAQRQVDLVTHSTFEGEQ